jgi:hypothetical protein
MTILQSLATRYDRLASENKAPIPGFAPSQISFTIVLDREGRYITTQDERTGEGKKLRPQTRPAPTAPKRTVDIASGAFWDKTSYVGQTRHSCHHTQSSSRVLVMGETGSPVPTGL